MSALQIAREYLLAQRNSKGHWEGELSSSALSTATAVCALALVSRELGVSSFDSLIEKGLRWLEAAQNPDGGWGDTPLSLSNISTTALGWAVFGVVPGADQRFSATVAMASRWLEIGAGGLEPKVLARAIIARYGKDRTFSVPILTMCALAGRLGPEPEAWQEVIPLPFEIAALPHQWFAAVKMPVVSYALPALIAIGQVHHHRAPSRWWVVRRMRSALCARTLKVLESIQPSSGGFLEATPLTSFVLMSLAGCGLARHQSATRCVDFLVRSVRADGSWAIDSNLSTWVTTLSIKALGESVVKRLPEDEQKALRAWLIGQQYREIHPYTHAAPGGWAWTDLPGGVPDADDTAGALLALGELGAEDGEILHAAEQGVRWLLGLQNRDGGIPTFCRGWGHLSFDQSSPDITAHTLRAWETWDQRMPTELQIRLGKARERAVRFLAKTQRTDGSWVPLWFGNQHDPADENPVYGTANVVRSLGSSIMDARDRGLAFLKGIQRSDGSWGADGNSSVEETALALASLADFGDRSRLELELGSRWLERAVNEGRWIQPAPIGFYFAKLWYYERLYPVIFSVDALTRVERWQKNGKKL